jgi:hypothetical protein
MPCFRRKLRLTGNDFGGFSEIINAAALLTTHTTSTMPKSRAGRGILITSNLPQLQNLIKVTFLLNPAELQLTP